MVMNNTTQNKSMTSSDPDLVYLSSHTSSDDSSSDGSDTTNHNNNNSNKNSTLTKRSTGTNNSEKNQLPSTQNKHPNQASPVWSANVVFYPPSHKYWRIGGHWYDFETFLDRHPGGREVLLMSRDRFEDCTFVFEAHHYNYPRARKIIEKYRVPASQVKRDGLLTRPTRRETQQQQQQLANQKNGTTAIPTHHDSHLDANMVPKLANDEAFYSVLRLRVARYLESVGCPDGGPTTACFVMFGAVLLAWITLLTTTIMTGSLLVAVLCGLVRTILASYGHNWVHQPKYKALGLALCLDQAGYSGEGWLRDHVLQHHMYTNTHWDHHITSGDPFIVLDPCKKRNWFQCYVSPFGLHVLLAFCSYTNYICNAVWIAKGQGVFNMGRLWFPLEHLAFWWVHGWYGLVVAFVMNATTANHFFTLALMNHMAEHTLDIPKRNQSKDWGEAQVHSCADFCVDYNFYQSAIWLWLNLHTVHHLFPKVDFSHHPAIQRILTETCQEFEIPYVCKDTWSLYKDMIHALRFDQAFGQEILVYGGGGI